MTCREIAGAIVCGPGPTKVYQTNDAGFLWCFVCRKRVQFFDRLKGEVEPSWYGPWWERTCPEGHQDGDLGFGRSREWLDS